MASFLITIIRRNIYTVIFNFNLIEYKVRARVKGYGYGFFANVYHGIGNYYDETSPNGGRVPKYWSNEGLATRPPCHQFPR